MQLCNAEPVDKSYGCNSVDAKGVDKPEWMQRSSDHEDSLDLDVMNNTKADLELQGLGESDPIYDSR